MSIDEYNLPVRILGPHPEEFYGAIGRIVCVSAVLEDKITTLRHSLAHAAQGQFTHEPVNKQIMRARTLSRSLAAPAADVVDAFLTRAEAAFKRRNELVHSSFPFQSSGQIWGHRPARNKAVTDGTADTVETSLDEMKILIGELANLVEDSYVVLAQCSSHA